MSMLFRRRLPLAPALLATALLAGAFLVAVPALVSAQPPPPHLFFGQVADVTINGAAWDGSLIEVIDEDGDVVATVNRDGDAWTVFVPPDAGSVRFRLGDAISQSFAISGGSLTQVALVLVDGGPGRTVLLVAGFNFVVWTGATMSVDDALASVPNASRITAIFSYVGARQAWDTHRPGGQAFLQSIDSFGQFDVLFIFASAGTSITQ